MQTVDICGREPHFFFGGSEHPGGDRHPHMCPSMSVHSTFLDSRTSGPAKTRAMLDEIWPQAPIARQWLVRSKFGPMGLQPFPLVVPLSLIFERPRELCFAVRQQIPIVIAVFSFLRWVKCA